MSKSAPRALFAATAFLLGSTALYAADMPVKAPPLPLQFSWAGAYIGVNAGAVLDRNDPGQLRLTSPGFVFFDPQGAFAGFPSPFFGIPGAFSSVPFNQSRSGASFIGGGQIGYNFQSGNIVYGVEADFQVMRNRDTLSGQLLEFTPGVLPTGSYTRNTFATYFIDRQWQATFRGRFGYAWDRLLVYATGGLAVTSLKTGGNYTFQTLIGPALAPFPGAPPQNFSAAGVGSSQEYYGVTFGGGAEYAFWNNWSLGVEYRFADFGKRNVTLVTAPAAGVLLPATPVTMPISLFSQQVTARLNYRFGGGEMATRSVALPGSPGSNWSGCYAGGYAGVAWGRGPVDTFDPSTNGQQVFGPPPLLQTTFYNSSAGESANPAPYSYNLGASGMGGGTLGCNWQPASSRFVWGIEAEAGVMRLSATVNNPYNLAFGFNDTLRHHHGRQLVRGICRPARLCGRRRAVLSQGRRRLHPGVGRVDRPCTTTGANCSSQALIARGSANPVFFVVGGGAEWAFVQNWTVKAEYLYLGLDTNFSACGPGGGRLFLPNLTFCSKHELNGIHTAKIGVNYKFF